MKYYYSLIVCICSILYGKEPWSDIYKYVPTKKECNTRTSSYHMTYKEKDTMPFTQLIISWNALRPKKGIFTFRVRVKNANTGRWDTLHKIAIWGKEQKSFFSRGNSSTYHYSRLEVESGTADAFEVDIEGDGDATMDKIKGLFVSICNDHAFTPEPPDQRAYRLPSHRIKRAVKKSQMIIDHPRANALCSPTSVSMLVQTLQKKSIDPLVVAQHVYDPALNIFGNWPFNMAHAFELTKGTPYFYVIRPSSFDELHEQIRMNIPVAVSIRGPIPGGHTPYKNGHLLVVVGWDADDRMVICYDPAAQELEDVHTEYAIDDFIPAWERSKRLTYFPDYRPV